MPVSVALDEHLRSARSFDLALVSSEHRWDLLLLGDHGGHRGQPPQLSPRGGFSVNLTQGAPPLKVRAPRRDHELRTESLLPAFAQRCGAFSGLPSAPPPACRTQVHRVTGYVYGAFAYAVRLASVPRLLAAVFPAQAHAMT